MKDLKAKVSKYSFFSSCTSSQTGTMAPSFDQRLVGPPFSPSEKFEGPNGERSFSSWFSGSSLFVARSFHKFFWTANPPERCSPPSTGLLTPLAQCSPSSTGVKTPLARFLRGDVDSSVDDPGMTLQQVPSMQMASAVLRRSSTSPIAALSLTQLDQHVSLLVVRRRSPRQVSEGIIDCIRQLSLLCISSPRLVSNRGGVSSHACFSRGLSGSASAFVLAPAALGVMPRAALAGDAVESCMHDSVSSLHDGHDSSLAVQKSTKTRLWLLIHADKRGGAPRSGQGLVC